MTAAVASVVAPVRRHRILSSFIAFLLILAAAFTGALGTGLIPAWAADTGVLNVKTGYGAAGDCSTNDTTAVANAVAALNAGTSGELYFPAGCYMVDDPASSSTGVVHVDISNVVVRGDGIGRTTIKIRSSQTTDVTGILRTKSGTIVSNVTFKDITVDGNKSGIGAGRKSICVYAGVTPQSTNTDTNVVFERVEAQNCTDYGFDPHERVTGLVLNSVVAHDNGLDGITLDGQYDATVTNSFSYSNGRHGLNLVTGTAGAKIVGSHFYSNTSNGVMMQTGAKRNVLDGNDIHDNTLVGVQINGVPQASPELDTTPGEGNTVSNNVIRNNGTHGVQLSGSNQNVIIGNQIRDNSQTTTNTSNGVYLAETTSGTTYFSSNNLVTGNIIRSDTANVMKYGVREQSTSDSNNFVDGNRITGAGTTNFSLLNTTSLSISTSARNPS